MGKTISVVDLSATLKLSECSDGFWLYDTTRGMNLAMRSATQRDALVSAITYYQTRLVDVEKSHANLNSKVQSFINQVIGEEGERGG